MIPLALVKRAAASMLRQAARDPLWAIVALVTFPLRYAKSFVMHAGRYAIVLMIVGYGIRYLTLEIIGSSEDGIAYRVGDWAFVLFAAILLLRMLSAPLINHFGTADNDTHGTARFASRREIASLAGSRDGLLIGRAPSSGRLLRYGGPAHLLTMAPTRSGKGVGTIIPNLLTADRSIICIDPKGENAVIAGDARRRFGPVHILDPFGITGRPSAAFTRSEQTWSSGAHLSCDARPQLHRQIRSYSCPPWQPRVACALEVILRQLLIPATKPKGSVALTVAVVVAGMTKVPPIDRMPLRYKRQG